MLFVLFSAATLGQTQDTTAQRQNRQKNQKMDRFIDADGDGICDHRAQGLGFGRGKHGEGKMKGKNQNGTSGTSTESGKQVSWRPKMRSIILILLSGIFAAPAMSQFTVETNIGTMLDDNIDNNYLQIADRIASGSLKTGYGWSSDQTETGFYYTGGLSYYSQIIDRSFYTHHLNFDYEWKFGEENASTLNASAGFSTRLDRGSYTIYDHHIYNGKLQLQHFFTDMLKGEGTYTFNYVRFNELPVFNYTEHVLSTEGAAYLSTKTTLIARANIGMKIYSTANYDSTTASSGMGHGRKNSNQSTPTVTQLIGMVRIGQSIFENTGLSLTAQYQWNIQKESRYLASEYGNISDDALFDDHYGYEGLQLSGMLTQVILSDARIRIVGSLAE